MDKTETIEAIKALNFAFSQCAMFWKAKCYEGRLTENERQAHSAFRMEAVHAQLDAMKQVEAAKRRLLATGFAVPDGWLTVRYLGEVGGAVDLKRKRIESHDTGPDKAGLEKVCEEMYAAVMRLEAAPERGTANGTPAERVDATLRVMGDSGKCTTAVAIHDFRVSRVTLRRYIAEGKLTNCRPAGAPRNSSFIFLREELEKFFQRKS